MPKVLGRGVYGTVYAVHGLALKRTRVYSPTEIRAMMKLRSLPFVPKIRAYGRHWFIMNQLPTGSKPWRSWRRTAPKVAQQKARRELTRNIEIMHRKGISHGDLHTDNVFVNRTGKVWIVDYGQAQMIPKGEAKKYTPSKYYSNFHGVPTYAFGRTLSRKNSNMLKFFDTKQSPMSLKKLSRTLMR